MDKKKQDIYDFDYPELDLSGDDDKQPQNQPKQVQREPSKKIKVDLSNNNLKIFQQTNNEIKKNPTLNSFPTFFPLPPSKGNMPINQAWVPPPPVQQRTPSNQSNINQQKPSFSKSSYNQGNSQTNRDNRQKNNLVYVKNIPKNFNTQQKLMTFFKNQGIIKQIKTNETQQSAIIRFLKDQHALKFLKSNKFIFNRSFIVYGNKDNLPVTQQQIQDRVTDQQGIIKKAQQTNMKVVKQKVISQIAQQIRTLYFFEKQLMQDNDQNTQQLKKSIIEDLSIRIELKNALQNQIQDKKIPQDQFFNQYNYCLIINRKSNQNIDKKALYAQFLKYGPIINIQSQYEIINKIASNNQKAQQNVQNCLSPQQIYDYQIKIVFLSLRNLWCYYNLNKQEQSMLIEGEKIQKLFDSRKLKTIEFAKPVEIIESKKTLQPKDKLNNSEKDDKIPMPINFALQNVEVERQNDEQ